MWGTIAAAGLSAVAMIFAAYATYRGNTRAKSIEGATPSYEALDRRMVWAEGEIGDLRAHVGQLLTTQHEDRMYIRRLIAERPMGLPLPLPIPGWLTAPYHPATPHSAGTPASIIEPPHRPPAN